MKISSNHHRFGLWWLRYLCLCCLQNTFWLLVEILPFLWICRCLSFVYCVEGVAAPIGWLRYLSLCCLQAPFLPLVEILTFWWIYHLIISRLLCRRSSNYLCSRCLQVTFLPLVETLLFLWICRCYFLICCVEGVATVRYESAALKRWWTVAILETGFRRFALDPLTSSMFHPFKG